MASSTTSTTHSKSNKKRQLSDCLRRVGIAPPRVHTIASRAAEIFNLGNSKGKIVAANKFAQLFYL